MSLTTVKYTEPATGTDVVFDDCGASGKVQLSKLDVGVAGTVTLVSAANPLPVQQTLLSSDRHGTLSFSMTGTNSVTVNTEGASSVWLRLTGITTGLVVFYYVTEDGTAIEAFGIDALDMSTMRSSCDGTDGRFMVFPCAGAKSLIISVYTIGTGTCFVYYRCSHGVFNPPWISSDIKKIGGNSVATGSGVIDTGTQRFVLATDQPIVSVGLDKWNGVAPTAAAALSDTLANPTAPRIGSHIMLWDQINSRWSRSRYTTVQTHLASAARTANTDGSALDVRGAKAVIAILSVSAKTSAPSIKLRLVGATSGATYYLTADPTAVLDVGAYGYELSLGGGGTVAGTTTPAIVQRTAGALPDFLYASIAHANGNSITYAVYLIVVY